MYVDSHRHFMQDCSSVDELLSELLSDGFERTLLFGYNGMITGDTSHSQDHKVLEIYKSAPEKIIPFLCDFDFEDRHVGQYIAANLETGIFRGIGEILIGHSLIKNKAFQNISYCDRQVIKVFKAVSEFKRPILVHVDAPFIADFISALKECGNCSFIWAHAAYDFTLPFGGNENSPEALKELLERYENLFFDISMWKISPIYFWNEKWLNLFESYNDRFLFGTDMTCNYSIQSIWVKAYELIFKQLSRRVAEMITRDNILKLCGL